MNQEKIYDCIIIGGGLAGLSLAILLAKNKKQVLIIEKKSWPQHKVCGEYVSMESWNFLVRLGLPLSDYNLPIIQKLLVSNTNGLFVNEALDLGGFGISRYKLDYELSRIAQLSDVSIIENSTVSKYVRYENHYAIESSTGIYKSKIVCASFGKMAFGNFFKQNRKIENWVGVKYHIHYQFPDNLIALHNFHGGYCGVSKIEDNKYCLCYLVKASQLKKYASNISLLEQEVLCSNPYLLEIFKQAKFLFDKPITISNITFSVKKPVEDHIFYLGDSAGTIAPLTGNGMSNALRSAFLLSTDLIKYFDGEIDLNHLERNYTYQWTKAFKQRIVVGRLIQHFFCKQYLTSFFILLMKFIKPLRLLIIRQSHGHKF